MIHIHKKEKPTCANRFFLLEKSCSQEANMNTAFIRSIKEKPHLPNDKQSCAVSCSSHISADV